MALNELTESIDRAWLDKFVRNGFIKPQHRNSTSPSGSALHSYSDVFRVRGLLAAGADPTTLNAQGKTPLDLARIRRHVEVANYISWEHGAIVHTLADCLGRPPVQMEIYGAVTHKRMCRFRFYVRRSVHQAFSELLSAARTGDLSTVRSMIENDEIGVDVMQKETFHTAFSLALANGHRHVCIYLMDRGAYIGDVCGIKGERQSTLVAATLTGVVAFVKRVVAHNAAVLTPTEDDTSTTCALAEAIKMGSIEMMEALLDLGSSYDRWRNGLDLPPLARGAQYSIMVSDPLDEKAEPWFLLCAACWLRDKPLVEYLLRTRPKLQDFSASPRNTVVVLFFAVYGGSEEITMELLRRGAPINQRFNTSNTAMTAAVMTNSTRMLQLLIDHGADLLQSGYIITQGINYDDALLTVAVSAGAMDCARMLLPLETRTRHRGRALVWAATRGEVEFAARLLEEARSSKQNLALINSIQSATCPLVLDLLLTRYCEDELPVSEMHEAFTRACRCRKRADLLAVFVAHGVDINDAIARGNNSMAHLLDIVLRGWKSEPCVSTLGFVLANGIPIVTITSTGRTPDQEMKRGYDQFYMRNERKMTLFAACREALAAYSTPAF